MKIAKLIALLGLVAMTAVLVYGFTIGKFTEEESRLLSMPWGIVSLIALQTSQADWRRLWLGKHT